MHFKTVAIVSLAMLLSACATRSPYPQNREDQAALHSDLAIAAISKGEVENAANQIDVTLERPTGDVRVRDIFVKYPKGRDYYHTYLSSRIAHITSPSEAATTFHKLSTIRAAKVFSESEIIELNANLMKVVAEGNISGAVPFEIGDDIDLFPALKATAHQQIILDRTIKVLQGDRSRGSLVMRLMEYAQVAGLESPERKKIESMLPTMKVRLDELGYVEKVYPKFASNRREEITAHVFLQVKNGDRLFADDLLQTLRSRVKGVDWVPSAIPRSIILSIEQVRSIEKTIPERQETITLAQSDVNFLGAVLLMPKNASYLYDVISGGAEIEYGYVVAAVIDGKKIHDEVVRGKVGGEYRRCQNARIQNVFGGVSPANFVANGDMESRCSNSNAASIDQLRLDVISRIVSGVMQVPPIKAAHELN